MPIMDVSRSTGIVTVVQSLRRGSPWLISPELQFYFVVGCLGSLIFDFELIKQTILFLNLFLFFVNILTELLKILFHFLLHFAHTLIQPISGLHPSLKYLRHDLSLVFILTLRGNYLTWFAAVTWSHMERTNCLDFVYDWYKGVLFE